MAWEVTILSHMGLWRAGENGTEKFPFHIRGQATIDMMLASIQRGTVHSDLCAEFLGWGEAMASAPQTKGGQCFIIYWTNDSQIAENTQLQR